MPVAYSKNPIDRMLRQTQHRDIDKRIKLCYLKAICDLGFDEDYVNQYEEGDTKDHLLRKIREVQLTYILELPTKFLEKAYKMGRCHYYFKKEFKAAIEKELIHRIVDGEEWHRIML